MSLIKCPECNREISDRAESCPHCGLPKEFSSNKKEEDKATYDYKTIRNMLISFNKDYASIFSVNKYISTSEAQKFYNLYAPYLIMLKNVIINKYLDNQGSSISLDARQVQRFVNNMDSFLVDIEKFNNTYIGRKLEQEKEYFDNILKAVDSNVMLDEEQRRAVITDDDYCLIVAGAGAGKTTTMAAKVKYLVEKQGVNPEDIIVISYTNKAIDELKERINKKLKIPVKISTFHSFGYDILRKNSDIPPIVNSYSYKIIFDCLEKKIFDNKKLLSNVVLFLGYYFNIPEEMFNFKSLNEYCEYKSKKDYETIKSRLGEYIKEVTNKRTKQVRTITGEFLRSSQEVQIANFLYMNNLDYEYEKPYKYEISNSRKIYTPDFYITQGENECYLEHFGISENYQSNLYDKSQLNRYISGIIDKRTLHKKSRTTLIETYSTYNDGKSLIDHLKEKLEQNGFILIPRDDEDIYKKLSETSKDKYIYRLIFFMINFIEKYKTCGYDEAGFDILRQKYDNVRIKLFLDIAEEVYKYYQLQLLSTNSIDYADMINDAEKMLNQMANSNYKPAFKYIIIDEFQDIARQRFNLTKSLVEVTGAKVIAVGDDWQSIYAFAGSDITLFQKFLELMGEGKEMQITHTYRNSQELIDIAGTFVQKNPSQIRKRLISPKSLSNPIKVVSYDNTSNIRKNWCKSIENSVGELVNEFGDKQSILMIGRYNFDMHYIVESEFFQQITEEKIKCRKYPNVNITFLTAHSSKGLGYDNVIIVNMIDDLFGFPSQIENDPIMKMVTYNDISVPFAEERRLFYVALTRTKNRVYMVTPNKRPSRFVLELIEDFKILHDENLSKKITDIYAVKCPICKSKLKYENNKNYGIPLYMCTNDPEICDFMTNNKTVKADIYKCDQCSDGYMIVKENKKNNDYFYGCTNFNAKPPCKNNKNISDIVKEKI